MIWQTLVIIHHNILHITRHYSINENLGQNELHKGWWPIGSHHSLMGKCKKDVTPLLTHWSYIFLALTHHVNLWQKNVSTLWENHNKLPNKIVYCTNPSCCPAWGNSINRSSIPILQQVLSQAHYCVLWPADDWSWTSQQPMSKHGQCCGQWMSPSPLSHQTDM